MKIKRKDKYPFETIKCLCGHSVSILYNNHKIFCNHCGRLVNTPKKNEFKDKLLKFINKNDIL